VGPSNYQAMERTSVNFGRLSEAFEVFSRGIWLMTVIRLGGRSAWVIPNHSVWPLVHYPILSAAKQRKLRYGLIIMGPGLIWRRSFLVLLVILIVESCSVLICWFLLPPLHVSQFLWNPDLEQARKNWDALSSAADDEIGGYHVSGAKYNSEFPDGGQSCGSAYGDSYVGGADVANGEGWVEQLSHLLGCRVTNYAVGGYGTDQAYLRFRQVRDGAPIAMLGINPNNVMDNVNQYDGLLGSALEPTALKGRFLLDPSDHLTWLPRPHLDADGFVAMNRNPAETLPHSYFLPDTSDGPVTLSFPYTVTLARVALMARLRNILVRKAEWSDLYDVDHPSGALRLMVAICQAFTELAKARGERPLIVMLPLANSFREKANYGEFEYAPLVTTLQAKRIEIYDPGAAMIESLAGRSACEFYTHSHPEMAWLTSPVPCGGHYSAAGNTTIAQLVANELRRRDFIRR
jgi:hypothetical protein